MSGVINNHGIGKLLQSTQVFVLVVRSFYQTGVQRLQLKTQNSDAAIL
jgi:hypothetical protein